HVYLNGADYQEVSASFKKIFGIQNFAPSYKIEKSVPALKESVVEIMQSIYKEGMTFNSDARRSDHNFELESRDINKVLGDA
ncbi:THUMP domain-containing protein, partial [Streptococcus suis]